MVRRPWDAPTYPDLLVQEMTGQGKTLAYLLPMLTAIDRSIAAVQGIIVVPTRELAVQVSRIAQELAGNVAGAKPMPYPLSVATLVGQVNPTMLSSLARSAGFSEPQILADENEERGGATVGDHHPHLIVATPGVLHEIFVQRKLSDVHTVLPLAHLKYIVFDEADALMNAAASRNLIVPIIQLRHQATALTLERTIAMQQHLDQTRDERRLARTMAGREEVGEEEEEEKFDENAVPDMPKEEYEEEHQAEQEPANATEESAPVSDMPLPALTPTFPRNQVVLVSATVTAAVHQFASRYLSQSRAFLTPQSVAHLQKPKKAKDGSVSTLASTDALVSSSPPQPPAATQRVPPHIKHYYLVVNRPYDRLNSLQQLAQAIKLQFDAWKKNQLMEAASNQDNSSSAVSAGGVMQKPPTLSSSWIKKHLGPERALSAGGVRRTNEATPLRHLRGGVSAMGIGAAGHFKQSSLVFVDGRETLSQLVNPLSQQGFNLGVVSEHSGRHERREALRLEKTELLLATDVLARGMDLKSLTHVINYAPPPTPNAYLHRAGRVGRLGAVHAKLGTVITLVDLQADPNALAHLSKVAGALGGGMELKRLYVKKGRIFEDATPESVVTATNVPEMSEFIVDKDSRQNGESHATTTRPSKRTPKEHSTRVTLGKPKRQPVARATTTATAAPADSSRSSDHETSTPRAHTAPRSVNLPLDPIGEHLSQADLHSPRRLAELELAQPTPMRRKRNNKNNDRAI